MHLEAEVFDLIDRVDRALPAARDAFVTSGMETGIRESYERLDEALAGMS